MMRCAEIVSAGAPLQLKSRPVPVAPPGGLVVKTSFSGVCHSDVHIADDIIDLGNGNTATYSQAFGRYIVQHRNPSTLLTDFV